MLAARAILGRQEPDDCSARSPVLLGELAPLQLGHSPGSSEPSPSCLMMGGGATALVGSTTQFHGGASLCIHE